MGSGGLAASCPSWLPVLVPSVERAAVFYLSSREPFCFHQRQLFQTVSFLPRGWDSFAHRAVQAGLMEPSSLPTRHPPPSPHPCGGSLKAKIVLFCPAWPTALPPSHTVAQCFSPLIMMHVPWALENLSPHTGSGRELLKSSCPMCHQGRWKVPEEISSTVQKIKFELKFSEILLSVPGGWKQSESAICPPPFRLSHMANCSLTSETSSRETSAPSLGEEGPNWNLLDCVSEPHGPGLQAWATRCLSSWLLVLRRLCRQGSQEETSQQQTQGPPFQGPCHTTGGQDVPFPQHALCSQVMWVQCLRLCCPQVLFGEEDGTQI